MLSTNKCVCMCVCWEMGMRERWGQLRVSWVSFLTLGAKQPVSVRLFLIFLRLPWWKTTWPYLAWVNFMHFDSEDFLLLLMVMSGFYFKVSSKLYFNWVGLFVSSLSVCQCMFVCICVFMCLYLSAIFQDFRKHPTTH
jgi:hypothetical protein